MRIDQVTFSRVVVPLDDTVEGEDILPLVRTIALATGARVELVHVVDPDDIVVMLPGAPTAGYPRRVMTKPRREPLRSQVSEIVLSWTRARFVLYPIVFEVEEGRTELLAHMTKQRGKKPKFEIGTRVKGNDRSPSTYRGRLGTVVGRGPGRAQYRVFFEGVEGLTTLYSWWLESVQ